ncbi:hypothetical protein BC828DRAFT_389993 [Blastocladiella britannica]|nr:hypothetical protein BC828DRAFT_389993 [Blastocladiella britannica]
MATKHALVYGGAGALGRTIVAHFKSLNWAVTSLDRAPNPDATTSVSLSSADGATSWEAIAKEAGTSVTDFDALVCVAGGWCGGNAAASDFVSSVETSVTQSIQTSAIAAHLAARHLRPAGLLVLTGSHAALSPTAGMIGYGMAKAAVHHLVGSLGAPNGGLPAGAKAVAILPVTLDTPMNRKFMPDADFTSWTPLETVAQQIATWANNTAAVPSGTLYSVLTKDSKTTFEAVPRA